MKKHKNASPSLLFSSVVMGGGLFLSRVIGAGYRIPLAKVLGAGGIGIYQMVFPLYSLLLTVSSSAIPASLAKIISENLALGSGAEAVGTFRTAKRLILILSLLGGVCLAVFAGFFARLQGEELGSLCYIALAPSVFFVGVIACERGKFQGMNNMVPTALSQIVEQVAKLAFSLSLPVFFGETIPQKVALAVLGVTISELFGLLFLLFCSRLLRRKQTKNQLEQTFLDGEKSPHVWSGLFPKQLLAPLLKIALPMTLSLSIYPICGVLESGIIIRTINSAGGEGVLLFGIYSGGVSTMLSLPLGVCAGISTALVPAISSNMARGEAGIATRKISTVLKLCTALSAVCAVMFLYFAPQISLYLFPSLALEAGGLLSSLLRFSSLFVVFSSFASISSAVLYSLSQPKIPLKSQLFGMTARFALLIFLLPRIGIYASVVSGTVGSGVSAILNFLHIRKTIRLPVSPSSIFPVAISTAVLAFCASNLSASFRPTLSSLVFILILLCCYLATLFLFGFWQKDDLTVLIGK